MVENVIPPRLDMANLQDYDEACRHFDWNDTGRFFSWHQTGKVNIAYEAIDRHAQNPDRADRRCLMYDHGGRRESITYRQMQRLSNKCANMLRSLGVAEGDRVFLFLPRIPELYIALAGCAKAGAVIAPLYSDYREAAVKERMMDGRGSVLVTTPRHRLRVPVDELPDLQHVIVVGGRGEELSEEDQPWELLMDQASDETAVSWLSPGSPLFLIYTSWKNGRPVGLLHSHDAMRGYYMTARWVLDLHDTDVLWTQTRPGWLVNVVYSAFAPWLCGVENFVTGQKSTADDIYEAVESYRVSVMYTVPTVYRIMAEGGEEAARRHDTKSLRHLLSVLEPLDKDLIYAVMRIHGTPVYDTWWTAETGMITIANYRCLPIKPGYLGKPFPGISAAVFDEENKKAPPFSMGSLALKMSWPAMVTGVWNNDALYREYMKKEPWFVSGDVAYIDQDGYFYYQGRADDAVITQAGRVGVGELEEALRAYPAVSEAAVVRVRRNAHGKKIKAYVVLKEHCEPSPLLRKKLIRFIHNNLSPETAPDDIAFCPQLPRGPDGCVLRVVLKAWELGIPVGNIGALTP